ncbi:CmNV_029-like protein [Aratus pisonii nudivirus]|nr:CmNV_029-like protein [Aratus pisonii nudivirus]
MKTSKRNKICVCNDNGSHEYKSIQHYNNFNQYTYDFKLAKVIDGSMMSLIKFGYENYNKNCRESIAINLVMKQQEKIKCDIEKKNKKKPVIYKSEDEYDEEEVIDENKDQIDLIETTYMKNDFTENNELIQHYMKYNTEQLKIKLKEPSVLLKFYQAFLFECDWELLFQFLDDLLKEGFCYATMMKLLIYLICNVTKFVCIANEREGQNRNLDILLKQYKYKEVITQLKLWTYNYKYSIYDLPQQNLYSSATVYDINKFMKYARNTKNIFFHMTQKPVNLEIQEMEFKKLNLHIKHIEYTDDECNKVIFDVIRITHLSTNTKINLSKTSWNDRLDKLKEICNNLNYKLNIAVLKKTNKRTIQYGKLPCEGALYHYIRTTGLGVGTLFFNSVSRKTRCNNMPNKRFRKITAEDLDYKKLKTNIETIDTEPNNSSLDAVLMSVPANPLTEIVRILTTTILKTPIDYNHFQHSQLQQQPLLPSQQQPSTSYQEVSSGTPLPSPIPSPNHNIDSEDLGNLFLINRDLNFTDFKEEDDF